MSVPLIHHRLWIPEIMPSRSISSRVERQLLGFAFDRLLVVDRGQRRWCDPNG